MQIHGSSNETLIIVHGGAGPQDPTAEGMKVATNALQLAVDAARQSLTESDDGLKAVVAALKSMETSETFNAGVGSALQADGQARVTSAIMVGETQSFSGIIGGTHIKHPSELAALLQTKSSRVLCPPGIDLLARKEGIAPANLIVESRLKRWQEKADTVDWTCDTVGCVVRTKEGLLWAGTSTGGRGYEYPGRVSDSGTVAGNYASRYAAVSATGVGEQIVDDAVSARLEGRVRDGRSLNEASSLSYQEAMKASRQYGWIAVDSAGNYNVTFTTKAMSYLVTTLSGETLESSMPKS